MSISAHSTFYRIALVQVVLRLISSERFMKEDQENRNYLGVFTIVKFSNDACQGKIIYEQHLTFKQAIILGSASNSVGQCLAYADCYMSGGYGDGSCAEVRPVTPDQELSRCSGIRSVLPLLHQLLRLHHQPEHHLPPEPRLPLRLLHRCLDTVRIQDYKSRMYFGLISMIQTLRLTY